MQYQEIQPLAAKVRENVRRVIIGNETQIDLILTAVVAGGHVLLEDVPGTGKTVLARALSQSLRCAFSRVQFTPDLLPADITGMSVYQPGEGKFVFQPGPGVYQHPPRRRDQPRHAAHAVGSFGVHGRKAGDRRRRHAPARRRRFSSSPRRTPSKRRAPSRCRKRSWTASSSASRSAIRPTTARLR